MRLVIAVVLCMFTFSLHAQKPSITPEQRREDLSYMNKYLKKFHPAYHSYTPQPRMDAFYDSLKNACSITTTNLDFLAMIRQAVGKVGCGHMGVQGTNKQTQAPALCPVEVWVLGRRVYVQSQDSLWNKGDEILSVNGQQVGELIPKMESLAFSDGYNTTHRTYVAEHNFAVFLYILLQKPDTYVFSIRNKAGDTTTINVAAKVLKPTPSKNPTKDTTRRVIQGNNVALYTTDFDSTTMLLDIDQFFGKHNARTYRDVFGYLKDHKIQNLILDLRNNGGGSIFKGNALLSYLLDEPIRGFTFGRKPNLMMLNPRIKAGFFERITPLLFMLNPLQFPNKYGWNHIFPFFKKKKNHFDGKLFVLTNGGTFSMASFVASHLKYRKNATVVGEETGGSEYGSRGMAGSSIILPHSRLRVNFNSYQITHHLGIKDSDHGVMPDYPTPYQIEDKLSNIDLELTQIKALITGHGKR
ncbi:MAG: S41 family peptidase [Spirosomataceae bacterium]